MAKKKSTGRSAKKIKSLKMIGNDNNKSSSNNRSSYLIVGVEKMDEDLIASNKRLKSARDSQVQGLNNEIFVLDKRETLLNERVYELNRKKREIAQENGNLNATDDDLVKVNAGGKIIVAKRSTLTQLQGSRMDALFSGHWGKKLMRDGHGRIFLDVDPTCFQAIVDHLNEMTIF
jgi:hypothetical protein